MERGTSALLVGLLAVQTVLLGVLLWRMNVLQGLLLTGPARGGVAPALQGGEPIDIAPADGPTQGPADAPVTIVEFSCFTCPSCADLQPTLRKLLADHAGRIRLAFRYFPLRPAGKPLLLATAAECARRQGRFWEAHDRLFARSPVIETAADLATELDDLGLDQAAFAECLAAEDVAARVRADLEAGLGYGVSFTPTLFINGRRPVATDLATLNRAVAASLAKGEA